MAMKVSVWAWLMDCGFCARTGMQPSGGRVVARTIRGGDAQLSRRIKGVLAVTDAIFMCRFYAGGYGDDMDNLINERLPLAQCKETYRGGIQLQLGEHFNQLIHKCRRRWVYGERGKITVACR